MPSSSMNFMHFQPAAASVLCLIALAGCMRATPDAGPESTGQETLIDLFMPGALAQDIATVDCTLSDGTATSCYEITVAGTPVNHDVGPFCPTTTAATEDEVGIWLDSENLYDVTGQFILDLPSIYNDDRWMLHDGEGNVRVTDTREAFEAAARPDVAEEYENYCVEGRMEWLEGGEPITTTVQIPVTPVRQSTGARATPPLGVTFNGVRIDAAAPVGAILGAYTIAAFDDCGGHVNPFEGYHMHAATGCGEVGDAPLGETAPFALALDGYTLHSPIAGVDLDACNGHSTEAYGYHYHAQSPELNGVLTCFTGAIVGGRSGLPGGRRGPRGGGPPPDDPPSGESLGAHIPHDHQ